MFKDPVSVRRMGATVLAIAALVGCTGSVTSTRTSDTPGLDQCMSEACRLALLDSSPSVSSYQLALDALADNCHQAAGELGNLAVAVQKRLIDEGLRESLLNILSDVDRRLGGARLNDCSGAFDAYVNLRLSSF